MSADPWIARRAAAEPGRRRTDALLAAGSFVAVIAATMPILRVIENGPWFAGAVAMAAAVLGAGYGARWLRLPGVAVALVELAVWALALTAVFGRATALLWVVPTPDTFALVPVLVSGGADEIMLGAAPLTAGPPLTFLLVAAVGLLAVAIDHVVLTARMPLLGAIGLVAVSLIPSIAVPGDVDVLAFVLLAIAILFLLRVDTRARQRPGVVAAQAAADTPVRTSGATATAIGIGTVAVLVAVIAAPLLPAPVARAGSGGVGTGTTIDPTLQLGDDLRQPRETEVLSVRSDAPTPPYLRAVTLSRFDGSVWEPDEGRAVPLGDGGELPGLPPRDADIAASEYRTSIEITDLDSPWLPLPYPATLVAGLGDGWRTLPDNRTIVSRGDSTQGLSYDVVSSVARPTLEQIRAREAGGDVDPEAYALPDGLPSIIADTAREVTAGAGNDYDALTDMQAWFRSSAFSYSLEAPVEDGFDGSGADAVARFLEQREGYCVHYASAFALMARTLGMPTRIVVGYLPGTTTNTAEDGQTVYAVSSSQLHAWPEVHFAGIGWVPFEPTNSLGVPTSFTSALTPGTGTPADRAPENPTAPSAAPSATPTTGPRLPDEAATGGAGGGATTTDPWPGIGIGALVLAALVTPGLLGALRHRRRLAAAADGDAVAAWTDLQEDAIDLGIPVPATETPRMFGRRLVAAHGASPSDVDALVAAIERASYADDGRGVGGADLSGAVRSARESLRAHAPRGRRLLGQLVPRSLVVRPGSAFAHPPEPAAAR